MLTDDVQEQHELHTELDVVYDFDHQFIYAYVYILN